MSIRARARQNVLVAAANAALEHRLITLECAPVETAIFDFAVGPHPAIGYVADAGFDEVMLLAIVYPTEMGRQFIGTPIYHDYKRFGAAATHGWLERRDGKYLQSGVQYHGSKSITPILAAMTVAPNGFGTVPTAGGYDYFKECDRVFGIGRKS